MTFAGRNFAGALLLGYAIFGVFFATAGYFDTWRWWPIPVAEPAFMDSRVLTAGAESFRAGFDPLKENPSDVVGRRLNYPRIWQGLFRLGMNDGWTVPMGIAFIALFSAGLIAFAARLPDNASAAVVLATVFSPAILLGIERGNTDLLMFFLLAIALIGRGGRQLLTVGCVLLAFVLKLFPLCGLAICLGAGRARALKGIGAASAFALLYVLFSYGDLVQIRAATPSGTWIAYGVNVLWMKAGEESARWTNHLHAAAALTVVGAVVLGARAWWRGMRLPSPIDDGMYQDAFRLGAACYLGTYLLGSNFDYRLMFAIFTIPQLMVWSRSAPGQFAWQARFALGALLVSVNGLWVERLMIAWSRGPRISFLLGESARWGLFLCLLYLFVCSLPEWMTREGWRSERRIKRERLGALPTPTGA